MVPSPRGGGESRKLSIYMCICTFSKKTNTEVRSSSLSGGEVWRLCLPASPESDPPHKIMRYLFYYSIWLGFSILRWQNLSVGMICIGCVPVSKRHFWTVEVWEHTDSLTQSPNRAGPETNTNTQRILFVTLLRWPWHPLVPNCYSFLHSCY